MLPGGACSERRARQCRSRRVLQDIGLERPAALCPAQHTGRHPPGCGRLRPCRRAGDRPATSRAHHHCDGQGGASRQDLRRLEPERPSQDDDRSLLVASASTSNRFHTGELGRRAERGANGSPSWSSMRATCSTASPTMGDLFDACAGTRTAVCRRSVADGAGALGVSSRASVSVRTGHHGAMPRRRVVHVGALVPVLVLAVVACSGSRHARRGVRSGRRHDDVGVRRRIRHYDAFRSGPDRKRR